MKRIFAFALTCTLAFGVVSWAATPAVAQLAPSSPAPSGVPKTRPPMNPAKRALRLKLDSSPQQAAVFWDAGPAASGTAARDYGVAGYTPLTLKVPKGLVHLVLELPGFKPVERDVDMKKNQTLNVTLERAPAAAKLQMVAASDGSSTGATVTIDGVSRGTVPNTFEMTAGRHEVAVRKDGYKPRTDWISVSEGESRTVETVLEREGLPPGTLLVMSDAGGEVWVDGAKKDAAPAVVSLSPGDHVVEVRKDGMPPWRQTVTVVSAQQVKVSASLGPAPTSTGIIRALASELDTTIYVDGEEKGKAPVEVKDLRPGEHIVEGRKVGFKAAAQTVVVKAGEQTLVRLAMEGGTDNRARGHLRIQSAVPDAEVFMDGSSLGKAPVDRSDIEPGRHFISVTKDGYAEFKREITIVEGQTIALAADLQARGGVRFLSTPSGAEVRVDSEYLGVTPLDRTDIAAGEHLVEIKANGYYDDKQKIQVQGGKQKIYAVDLKPVPTGPTPEQKERRKGGMSSFGARVNPVGGFTADVGMGYPYYFIGRLTVGAFNLKPLGLDVGIEFTTYFQIYNLDFHGRLQLAEFGPFSAAIRGDLGGGTGSSGRSSFFGDLTGLVSLDFADVFSFSASMRWSAWTDRFCPTSKQVSNGVSQSDFCTDSSMWPSLFNGKDPNHNISGSRIYAGFAGVAKVDQRFSVFLQIEFLPFPSFIDYDERAAFRGDVNGALFFARDHFVYGSGGFSMKF